MVARKANHLLKKTAVKSLARTISWSKNDPVPPLNHFHENQPKIGRVETFSLLQFSSGIAGRVT
jgi:hypothetical protein